MSKPDFSQFSRLLAVEIDKTPDLVVWMSQDRTKTRDAEYRTTIYQEWGRDRFVVCEGLLITNNQTEDATALFGLHRVAGRVDSPNWEWLSHVVIRLRGGDLPAAQPILAKLRELNIPHEQDIRPGPFQVWEGDKQLLGPSGIFSSATQCIRRLESMVDGHRVVYPEPYPERRAISRVLVVK